MNYYRHFIGDYLRKTVHLTMLQDGAYRRLIDEYYVSEKALTLDRQKLYARVRANTQEERWAIDTTLEEFFTETPQGFVNKKAEEEIEFANSRAKVARTNGLAGGRPKTQRVSSGLAKTGNASKALQTLDSRLQTEAKPKTTHTPAKPGFRPPSQEEVCGYMKVRNIPNAEHEAEQFFMHHSNRKWRLSGGKGPVMDDWRKAVITWQGNIGKFGGRNGTRQAATGGVTRAEQRLAEAQRQSESVFGRASKLVGTLCGDLPGRPPGAIGHSFPQYLEAPAIEAGSAARSALDSGKAITGIPPKTGTRL